LAGSNLKVINQIDSYSLALDALFENTPMIGLHFQCHRTWSMEEKV